MSSVEIFRIVAGLAATAAALALVGIAALSRRVQSGRAATRALEDRIVTLARRADEAEDRANRAETDALTLRHEIEALRGQTVPLLADTRAALRRAEATNIRADDLITAATSLTTTADAAGRLAYGVATAPVVKAAAFTTGVGRGLAHLVGRAPKPRPGAVRELQANTGDGIENSSRRGRLRRKPARIGK